MRKLEEGVDVEGQLDMMTAKQMYRRLCCTQTMRVVFSRPGKPSVKILSFHEILIYEIVEYHGDNLAVREPARKYNPHHNPISQRIHSKPDFNENGARHRSTG